MALNELPDFSNYDSQLNFTVAETASNGTYHSLQPTFSGPSHDYDLYRQQTGIPLDAFASTLAVNQQQQCSLSYQLNAEDNFLDFESAASCDESPMDNEFDTSNPEPTYFYSAQSTLTPGGSNIVLDQPLSSLPTQVSSLSRLWPGVHQQQAEEEARQKNLQKQAKKQQIHDGTTNNSSQKLLGTKTRVTKSVKDPIVEDKISQILKSMRQTNSRDEFKDDTTNNQGLPSRGLFKTEEEMDDDERLLASEEGKKLSSKERRQLRNKVSARAFRSRRKEYINQLEDEIAIKTNENEDLRAQNQALIEENTRLSDLTRMLISSPSFSGFIDTLAMSPGVNTNVQPFEQQAEKNTQPQPPSNKDINPIVFQQQMQQQYLNTPNLMEPSRDFSTLEFNIEDNPPNQPQVFFVQNIPETVINFDVISCKTYSSLDLENVENKINLPQIECRNFPEIIGFEKSILGCKKSFEDSSCTLFEINQFSPSPKKSVYRLPLPTRSSSEQQRNIKSCVNAESDAALEKAYRLVAETNSCFKRLLALTRNL